MTRTTANSVRASPWPGARTSTLIPDAGKIFGHEDTVIRGGYGRIYGRLNGVDQALVPLLGIGPIQPVQCFNNLNTGTCAGGSVTPSNLAFRIGATSAAQGGPIAPLQTAPEPDTHCDSAATYLSRVTMGLGPGSASEALDPHFRPNVFDSFNFTIQRQLTHKSRWNSATSGAESPTSTSRKTLTRFLT